MLCGGFKPCIPIEPTKQQTLRKGQALDDEK